MSGIKIKSLVPINFSCFPFVFPDFRLIFLQCHAFHVHSSLLQYCAQRYYPFIRLFLPNLFRFSLIFYLCPFSPKLFLLVPTDFSAHLPTHFPADFLSVTKPNETTHCTHKFVVLASTKLAWVYQYSVQINK